jgi:hypothetical protein
MVYPVGHRARVKEKTMRGARRLFNVIPSFRRNTNGEPERGYKRLHGSFHFCF